MTDMFSATLEEMSESDPARKAVQKLLIHSCSERDISSQEVLHLATGKKLFSASRGFVKLNIASSEWVPAGQHHPDFEVPLQY